MIRIGRGKQVALVFAITAFGKRAIQELQAPRPLPALGKPLPQRTSHPAFS
jgi:hypothetical protein